MNRIHLVKFQLWLLGLLRAVPVRAKVSDLLSLTEGLPKPSNLILSELTIVRTQTQNCAWTQVIKGCRKFHSHLALGMGNLSILHYQTMSPVGHTFLARFCSFACSIDLWLRWSSGTWKQWTLYSRCFMWSCSFHRQRSRSSGYRSSPSLESCRGTHRIAWWKGPCSYWDPAACYTHRSAGP